MKHKHYEMIVAKAANMDLVGFVTIDGLSWSERRRSALMEFGEDFDYFLCLPQHKEACLHWLNGGEVQTRNEYSDLGWDTLLNFEGTWSEVSHFMCTDILLRIKPKKEKRWILHVNGTLLTTRMFTSEGSAKLWIEEFDRVDEGVCVSEIEVEV